MSLFVQKPGILTTIQDLGRHGFRRLGINPGGVMDGAAARLVNILLGNDDGEPVLEMHFPAPQITFEANTIGAIGGADLNPTIDDEPLENWRPFFARKGNVLKFCGKALGNRTYLAVKGGFKADTWLGSASTNLAATMGGFHGRRLEQGDRLKLKQGLRKHPNLSARRIGRSIIPHYGPFPTVHVIAGAEFEHLDTGDRSLLLNQDFTVSNNSNRMGFRLVGEPVTLTKPREFLSAAVSFGTVQILPDGQLIVLMADHQTAGGYPRIAHVITHDLPLLAQLGANDKIAFHLIENDVAESLSLKFERELNFLRIACKFQANSW